MENLKSWLDAGKSHLKNQYIHPSGVNDDEYNESGRVSAERVLSTLWDYKHQEIESILEYGCGNGRILRHIYLKNTFGVDITPEFVDECKERNLNAELLENFHQKVDAVYSVTVFIHLTKDEGKKALQYIFDHLNDGGIALIECCIYDVDKEPNSWIDVGTWTEKLFVDTCKSIGFQIFALYCNKGEFSYTRIGKYHNYFQVLMKPKIIRS